MAKTSLHPYLDARYLHRVLDAIDNVLRDAANVEVEYLKRLTAFAEALNSEPTATPITPDRRSRDAQRHARPGLGGWLAAARGVKGMLSQAWRLRRSTRPNNALIAVVSSTRLYIKADGVTPRQNLALLAKQLGPGLGPQGNRILEAESVLLMDVLPISRQWSDYQQCSRDRVVIVDGGFALVFFVQSLLTDARRKLPMVFALLREAIAVARERNRPIRDLLRTLFYGAITSAYGDLIERMGANEAVFFTCNSRLGEILRAFLIQRPDVTRIVELMHGIGSRQSEALAQSILTAGETIGDSSKHHYVPQVPGVPLHGVFARQRWPEPEAVNAFLNQYFVESVRTGGSLRQLVEAEYDAIEAHARGSAPVVITLFGNYPYDGKLFDSPTFRAEYLLIQLITSLRATLPAAYCLSYVPHPMQVAITAHPVFHQPGLYVGSSSIMGWLLSDLGASLVSSTIFEAAFFGVKCFTPVIPSDGFFTPDYLNVVAHPKSASLDDFVASLNGWMADAAPLAREAVVDRALRRLSAMGWDQHFERSVRNGAAFSLSSGLGAPWRPAIA